MVQKLLYMLY